MVERTIEDTWKTNTRVGITSFSKRNSNSHHQDYLLYVKKGNPYVYFFPGWGLPNKHKQIAMSAITPWAHMMSFHLLQHLLCHLPISHHRTEGDDLSFTHQIQPFQELQVKEIIKMVRFTKQKKLVNFINNIRFTHILLIHFMILNG